MKALITGIAGTGKSTIVKALNKKGVTAVDRLCDIGRLKEMLGQYDDIVMAGSTSGSNQKEFFSLFDEIILLQSDPQTLIHRMQTRTNKSGYGKTEAEQEDNIEWQKEYDPLLISFGAIPVSTEGNLDDVVGRITEIITKTQIKA
jgi:broad-specificity NMP kinase